MATRRRNSRRRSRKGISIQTLRVIAAVALVGIFIYIALATSVGTFLAENLVAPIFRALSGEETPKTTPTDQEGVATSTPSPNSSALPLTPSGGYSSTSTQPVTSERSSDEIRLESRTYYVLQMGAFTSEQNALKLAGELKGRAAAGYVYSDEGLYRVLAAAYESKEDARAVKDQLMQQNGLDSKINELVLPAVALRVTAGEEQLDAVQKAFNSADSVCSELFEICESFDRNELTIAQVTDKLNELADSCDIPAKALSGSLGNEAGALSTLLSELAQDLRNCASNNDENTVEFSAALKYTQIKEVCAFTEFLKRMG